ncbi:hypothetical protein PFFCH_00094 [Plasmodium falciparum FCH/4]|uniref:Surface antigen n=1 Tax=Plasmodium falciparum FCH/4 TaxID=1036724 RepID=A0A024VUS1_PLAFA|nr:hypothetical protein PFFCH_00094 [Plasmodium falciparum FCH/4]
MKVHYINILLFALPLNILIYNQRNHKSTTHHTLKIPITRLLCECELYTPANYDNDPQMKEVMDNFNRQTQQRFHEYDERMKTTRQKCKDRCDKEIQKIILKDKLEKELAEKFVTLQTDIQNDAIPTCVCEKSLEDKMEKACLRCTQNLGGIVAPSSGVLAGIAELGLSAWKTTEIAAATQEAIAKGLALGKIAGDAAGATEVIAQVELQFRLSSIGVNDLGSVINVTNYNNTEYIFKAIFSKFEEQCMPSFPVPGPGTVARVSKNINSPFCNSVWQNPFPGNSGSRAVSAKDTITNIVNGIVEDAKFTAEATAQTATEEATNLAMETNTAAVKTAYGGYQTAIIASIVAIVVIVLIMVIIYLILRYRRKKKMKKKLQYIKLLEE